MKVFIQFLTLTTTVLLIAGCAKPGGGGCVAGPGLTHAFLTYTNLSTANSSTADIYLVELDKSHLRRISNTGGAAPAGFRGYSTLFTSNVVAASDTGGNGTMHIYLSDFKGGGVKPLTTGNFIDAYSAISSRGKIAFTRSVPPPASVTPPPPNQQIFLTDITGVDAIQLTPSRLGGAGHSCWSYDGSSLFYQFTDSTGIPHIYSIHADGTGLTKLTTGAFGEEYPALSPDGRTIALASYMDAGHNEQEICFMNLDGSNLRKITNLGGTTVAHMPCWSPVGDQFFFSCFDGAKPEPPHIFSARLDGTNVQQFTTGSGEEYPYAGYVNYMGN